MATWGHWTKWDGEWENTLPGTGANPCKTWKIWNGTVIPKIMSKSPLQIKRGKKVSTKKNCKKQRLDSAAPCMPYQGSWNFPFHHGKHWSFKGNNMVALERSPSRAKWGRNWANMWSVTNPTERQIDRLTPFFYPSWCSLFPPTPSAPHLLPISSGPLFIRFLCGEETTIFPLAPGHS